MKGNRRICEIIKKEINVCLLKVSADMLRIPEKIALEKNDYR